MNHHFLCFLTPYNFEKASLQNMTPLQIKTADPGD